ncbi:hypothetical protein [Parasitella parasitica]|uniref:Fungal-type protein kinase domain-containing protein n=1 Tax=Parasitella parasitica TaxID=35722 RepID=A0A0B7N352_9FUNG|nr:hypothetical protein [Parasitella parasitica]
MLLNIKQSIERPVINKQNKSEIDFIVKNVAPFLDSIFNTKVYIEWEKASATNTTSEGCNIRTDFLLYDTYQELGCGEVKVGNVCAKLLDEDRARLGEMLKKQLHDRIFHAKTQNEFKTFGFFIYNSTIEIYTCEFTNNKEYVFVLLRLITLPTLKTSYTAMEEALEIMMSFKEMIIASKHDERLSEVPYIYHNYISFLKPTVSMVEMSQHDS